MTQDNIRAPIPRKPSADPLERCNSSFETGHEENLADDKAELTSGNLANKSSSTFGAPGHFRSFTPSETSTNRTKQPHLRHQLRRPSYCSLEQAREHHYNLDYPENWDEIEKLQHDPNSRFYARKRPRTLNLPRLLPYQTESPSDQAKFLSHIVSHLYISICTLDIQGSLSVTVKDLASVKANLSDVDVALETNLFEATSEAAAAAAAAVAATTSMGGSSDHMDDEASNYFSVENLGGDSDTEYDDEEEDDEDDEDDDEDDDDEEDGQESAIQHKKSPKSAAVVGVRIWTHELLVWLKMKYEMPVKLRIALARVYYAICLSRGQHINLRTYVKTFQVLTKDQLFLKEQGLSLPWEALCSELESHLPAIDDDHEQLEKKEQKSLLRLAEKASPFFDKSALPQIYSRLGSKFSLANVSNVLASMSLLPISFTEGGVDDPFDIRHYISSFFYMWSKLYKNSAFFGDLHLASRLGTISMAALTEMAHRENKKELQLGAGVFSADQMDYIFNTLMNSLSIMNEKYASMKASFFHGYSSAIIFSIKGSTALERDGIIKKLQVLLNAIESYIHPSNSGEWSRSISKLILSLIYQFHKRYNTEVQEYGTLNSLPEEFKLGSDVTTKFVEVFLPLIRIGVQSKSAKVAEDYQTSMHLLAYFRPEMVLETMLIDVYESLEGVISTHRVTAALRTLEELARYFASTPIYRVHLTRLLSLALPGIDSNDLEKSTITLNGFAAVANFVPFHDLTEGEGDPSFAIQFTSEHLEFLQQKLLTGNDSSITFDIDTETEVMALKSSSSAFKLVVKTLFERVFLLVENIPDPSKSTGIEKHLSEALPKFLYVVFEALSDDIFKMVSDQLFKFISENTFHTIADVIAEICGGIIKREPKLFKKFALHLIDRIKESIEEYGAGASRTGIEIVPRDQPLFWNLVILNECIGNAGEYVVNLSSELKELSFFLMEHVKGPAVFASSYMLNQMLQSTTKIRIKESRLISPSYQSQNGIDERCWGGFQFDEIRFKPENVEFSWFIPSKREIKFAVDCYSEHASKSLNNIMTLMKKFSQNKSDDANDSIHLTDELRSNLLYLGYSVSGISYLFDPSFDEDIPKLSQHQTQTIQQRLVLLNQIRQMKSSGNKSNHGKDELRIENIHENLQRIVEDLDNNSSQVGLDFEKLEEEFSTSRNLDVANDNKRSEFATPEPYNKLDNSEDVDMLHTRSDSSGSSVDASARTSPKIDSLDMSTMNPGITFRDQKLYTSNYIFGDDVETRKSSELYLKVHRIRHLIGKSLHIICKFLVAHFKENTKLFKHYLYVLNIWFSDVGRERLLDFSHAKINVGYVSALQHINKVKKPFTRIAIGARLEAYHSLRVVLHATSRTQTDLDKMLLEDVVKLCFSTYSAISKPAQDALVDAMKRLNGSYNVLVRSSLKLLSKAVDEKDFKKIESGLRTFGIKRIKNKIQNDYFNIQRYVELLHKCLLVDNLEVNALAQKLFKGVYNNISPPSSVCIVDMSEIDSIRPPDEYIDLEINVVRLAKETKRKIYFDKLQKFERSVLENEKTNSHWKSTSLNLCLLINLQLDLEIPVNNDVLQILAKEASNDHPIIARLAMKGVTNTVNKIKRLSDLSYNLQNAYDFKFVSNDHMVVDTRPRRGISYFETWRQELKSDSPNYFIDHKPNSGWLFWDKSMMALKPGANKVEPLRINEVRALQELGKYITKDWFLGIVKLWVADNESNSAFQAADVFITRSLVQLMSMGYVKNFTFTDLLSIVSEIYEKDEKSAHIVVCELFAGILVASGSMTPEVAEIRDEFICKFLGDIFENDLTPDNRGVWNIFSWWLPSHVDVKRFPKIIDHIFTDFHVEQDSDAAIKTATRLNFIKSFGAAITWSFPDPDKIASMALENMSNRYQVIRDQIGSLLAILSFVYYTDSISSSEEFLTQCNNDGGLIFYERAKENKIHSVISTLFESVETSRLEVVNLSPQEILYSDYIYATSTILTWLGQVMATTAAGLYQEYVDIYIIPFLLNLINMKDVCQLGNLDPVTVFKRVSQIPFHVNTLERIIVMIESYSKSDSLNVIQSIIMGEFTETFYFKNLYGFSKSQRQRIISLTNNLIYHKNIEVREAASSTLSGLIHISPPDTVDELVIRLRKKYAHDLDSTRKKYRSTGYKNFTTADTITLHAATLGLGSLIHAFPFLSPPPKWVPNLLTMVANKSSGIPGIVGKTAKETLGKFKKNRQDTWHLDSKVFNEDQMQDLEGVLWKSYFI
ncbi:proteasome activator Blm10p [[Candida] anglica]|uniref:Proteasome activator Blm10p n=1 Tax=[Candida] anglica TaxID=148631 RepID=A0ABP0EB02_9ASCO